MRPGELATRLARSNPWWRDQDWADDDRYLRAAGGAPFDYRPRPLDDLRAGGLYLLRGPRRVGKSTELRRTVADLLAGGIGPRRVIHIAVDGWASRELVGLVRAAATFLAPASEGSRYWFIDEVTSVRGDWPSEIKWLRDNDADFADDTVVLTGSSTAGLDDATKALAGRQGPAADPDRILLPMSFIDFCRMTELAPLPALNRVRTRDLASRARDAAYELLPWIDQLLTAWEVYLQVGGYPQAVTAWATNRAADPAVTRAIWQVVCGDALSRRQLSSLQVVGLLRGLSRKLCGPLNVSGLARELDLAKGTVDGAISDLVRSYLVWPVHREHGLAPSLRSQSKYFFTDPMLARLAEHEPDPTQLTEQQVGLALLRAVAREEPGALGRYDRLMYYRSASGSEIDFVGPDLGGAAVECKYVDQRWGRELATIRASRWSPVVATRAGVDLAGEALAIPAPILVALLGG